MISKQAVFDYIEENHLGIDTKEETIHSIAEEYGIEGILFLSLSFTIKLFQF